MSACWVHEAACVEAGLHTIALSAPGEGSLLTPGWLHALAACHASNCFSEAFAWQRQHVASCALQCLGVQRHDMFA